MKDYAAIWKILRPVKNQKDYEAALGFIEEHFHAPKGSAEGNMVDVLSLLVEQYEEKRFPIDHPDPIEAIRFRMEQLGWTNRDLVSLLGSKSRASEVLGRKRRLSLTMIRKLHRNMRIPAEVLIQA